jgi:hypothetical protein
VVTVIFLSVGALLGVAFLGWVAGMWTHRRAEQWCPECGMKLSCADCRQAGLHQLPVQR